jgi:hypothetical protein
MPFLLNAYYILMRLLSGDHSAADRRHRLEAIEHS